MIVIFVSQGSLPEKGFKFAIEPTWGFDLNDRDCKSHTAVIQLFPYLLLEFGSKGTHSHLAYYTLDQNTKQGY